MRIKQLANKWKGGDIFATALLKRLRLITNVISYQAHIRYITEADSE